MGWENGTGVQKIQAREDSPEVGKKADLRLGWMWTTDEGLRQGKETDAWVSERMDLWVS